MGKVAFLFSGQGAQYPGMGKALYERFASVRALFETAEAIRPGTTAQCFESDAETLKKTENTQPCLFLADLAAAVAVRESGVEPDGAAGFSLGELAALTFAGAFGDTAHGFEAVCRRGALMGQANARLDAGMVAAVKLNNEAVETAAAKHGVYPVNYNCPGQLVVSGEKEKLASFCDEIKALGGRALPLAVSGAFHSPYMDEAAAAFSEYLSGLTLAEPNIPVYANWTARPYGADVRGTLSGQMNHPVRWEATVRALAADGFDTFIETGVGDTLKKLVLKTIPGARVYAVNSPETLDALIAERT